MNSTNLVSEILENFRQFLVNSNSNYSYIFQNLDWDNNPYWFVNWLESNWQSMVGEIICGKEHRLRPYSFPTNSLSICSSSLGATHEIICFRIQDGEEIGIFWRFGTLTDDGIREDTTPFNVVSVIEKSSRLERFMNIDSVSFVCRPIWFIECSPVNFSSLNCDSADNIPDT